MAAVKLTRILAQSFQALIVGRVIDVLTQTAPTQLVQLELKGTSQDWLPETLGLTLKQFDNGSFAYYGDPLTAFPNKTQAYPLRLTAMVEGYPEKSVEFTVGPLNEQPEEVTFTPPMLEIGAIPARLYRGGGLPKRGIKIELTRNAVRLQGMVTNAQDPAVRVDGASVKIRQVYKFEESSPSSVNISTVADANGEFSLPLPVAQAVMIEIQKANYQKQSFTYMIDYSQPVNTVQFTLFPD